MIEVEHPQIPVVRQCALLGLARSSFYYREQPQDALNLTLMDRIDRKYTETPFYGARRMTLWLRRQGYIMTPENWTGE